MALENFPKDLYLYSPKKGKHKHLLNKWNRWTDKCTPCTSTARERV